MIRNVVACLLSLIGLFHFAAGQLNSISGTWKGILTRKDSVEIVFLFSVAGEKGAYQIKIKNAKEELVAQNVQQSGDSLFFEMPFFESSFRVAVLSDGQMVGKMIKGTSGAPVVWPFRGVPNTNQRFPITSAPSTNISGRWAATFSNGSGRVRPAVAEFTQEGGRLYGSFLTPSGDYRFLEGVVSGDSLYLSAFDGSHVYLFTARIASRSQIIDGWFYGGSTGKEQWRAQFDPQAVLPDMGNTPSVIDPELPLSFQFPNLDSTMVSLADDQFRNKVIVVQLMGSWCPNCMDETRFLSEFYIRNRHRGVEIIALAYEYSTDFIRSRNSLSRFKDRFNVQYPLLITGVRVTDTLRTEKTLPNITAVKVFPTTLYLSRDHTIRKIETGFNGPGTGKHYDEYRKDFEETVDALLRE